MVSDVVLPPVMEVAGGRWGSCDTPTAPAVCTGPGDDSAWPVVCSGSGAATTEDAGEAGSTDPAAAIARTDAEGAGIKGAGTEGTGTEGTEAEGAGTDRTGVEGATGIGRDSGADAAAAGFSGRVVVSAGDAATTGAATVPGGAGRTTAEVAARLRAHGVEAGARTAEGVATGGPPRASRPSTATAGSGEAVTIEEATTAGPGAEIASAEAMAAFNSPVTREASVISFSSVVTKARSSSVSTFGVSFNDVPACRHRGRAGPWVGSAGIPDMTHTDM